MNKTRNYSVALKILMWIVISINSIYILTGIVITADSVRYMYAAQTFPDPKHLIGNGYFSIQPLLYPIFLKCLSLFGELNKGVSFAVFHLLLYIGTIYFALKTIDLFKDEEDTLSFFGKLFLLCSYGLLHVFDFAWSESLFITILSASIFFLAKYSKTRENRYLLTYLLLCGLLPVTRYIGMFIFIYNLLYIAYLFRQRRANFTLVVFYFLALLPFALNLAFNYVNSGVLTGGERGVGRFGFFKNLAVSIISVLKGSPIPLKQIGLFLSKNIIIGAAAIVAFVGAIVILIRQAKLRFNWKSHVFRFGTSLLLIAFVYLLVLAYTATNTAFDVIDMRLVSPVLLPLLILFSLLLFQVDFKYKNLSVVVVSFALFGLFAKRMHHAFSSRSEQTYVVNSGLLYRKYYSHDQVFKQLQDINKNRKVRFFTNDPYRLMMYTGIPSEFLPERNFYNSPTPKFSEQAAQREVSSDSAIIVVYETDTYNAKRFYPVELYLQGKSALVNGDSLKVYVGGR